MPDEPQKRLPIAQDGTFMIELATERVLCRVEGSEVILVGIVQPIAQAAPAPQPIDVVDKSAMDLAKKLMIELAKHKIGIVPEEADRPILPADTVLIQNFNDLSHLEHSLPDLSHLSQVAGASKAAKVWYFCNVSDLQPEGEAKATDHLRRAFEGSGISGVVLPDLFRGD